GWWPGGGPVADAAFYAYAAPEPPGFSQQTARPQQAFYSKELGEFLLMYEDVRTAGSPTSVLLDFLESTYEAGATLGKWDRQALEYPPQPTAEGAAQARGGELCPGTSRISPKSTAHKSNI